MTDLRFFSTRFWFFTQKRKLVAAKWIRISFIVLPAAHQYLAFCCVLCAQRILYVRCSVARANSSGITNCRGLLCEDKPLELVTPLVKWSWSRIFETVNRCLLGSSCFSTVCTCGLIAISLNWHISDFYAIKCQVPMMGYERYFNGIP